MSTVFIPITPVKRFLLSKLRTLVTVMPLFMMRLKRFGRMVLGRLVPRVPLVLPGLKGHKALRVFREKLVQRVLRGQKALPD
jgi:hypothetical protein